MRISIALLIFVILLNGWAGLLQQYDIDDHLGINAETGDHEEIEQAQAAADDPNIGSGGVFESLIGGIEIMVGNIEDVLVGLQPAVQMLTNIVPPGIAESLIVWAFSVLNIIIFVDIANYLRGTG